MKKFIIERNVPGAGKMSAGELQAMSKVSVSVITVLGRPYRWIESFITDDKIFCIHEAINEDDIVHHSECGDFPVDIIREVKAVIGPDTALESEAS